MDLTFCESRPLSGFELAAPSALILDATGPELGVERLLSLALENSGAIAHPETSLLEIKSVSAHCRWRDNLVSLLVPRLDPEKMGIVGLYLFGSVDSGEAGEGSDIDLIAHFRGSESAQSELRGFFDELNSKCCAALEKLTGQVLSVLIEVKIVTDQDLATRTQYASLINSPYQPARPLFLATSGN